MSGVDAILTATFELCTQPKIETIVTLTSTHFLCRPFINNTEATLKIHNSKSLPNINIDDIIGCTVLKSNKQNDTSAYMKVIAYPRRKKLLSKKTPKKRLQMIFRCKSSNHYEENLAVVQKWKLVLGNILDNYCIDSTMDLLTLPQPRKRHLLILINPFSGKGKAQQIFEEEVLPILKDAEISFEVILTKHQYHAYKLMENLDLQQYYGIVIASGDGLIHEVYNGLMQRPDWRDAVSIPIGCIPGGSGNALCCSICYSAGLHLNDQLCLNMSLMLTKCYSEILNLVVFESNVSQLFGFLSFCWGLFADVDIESERFRSLGDIRFSIGAIIRLISLRKYRGRLSYLLADDSEHNKDFSTKNHSESDSNIVRCRYDRPAVPRSISVVGTKCTNLNAIARGEGIGEDLPPLTPPIDSVTSPDFQPSESSYNLIRVSQSNKNDNQNNTQGDNPMKTKLLESITAPLLPPLTEPVPKDWKTIDDEFVTVVASFLSHLSPDLMTAPNAKFQDDCFNLIFIRSSAISKTKLISLFLNNMEDGSFLNDSSVESYRVKAFRLEPFNDRGIMTVDGEKIDYGPIQGQLLPGIATIMAKGQDNIK